MRLTFLVLALACAGLHAQVTVLNGASNRVDQPLTFGSWATAYGAFAGVATTTASGAAIPKTLGGVTVTIDAVEAPVYFISATQINFLVPFKTATGVRPIRIVTPGATFNGNVRIISTAPGIFPKDGANPPKGAILNQDFVENTQNTPERRGRAIQIFATGPGALTADTVDGAAAPSTPLAATRSTPQVFIAGVQAQVQFSGMAPGLAGVWQVNAVVPDLPFVRGRVPVQIFMDGVDSNEVGVFVAQ